MGTQNIQRRRRQPRQDFKRRPPEFWQKILDERGREGLSYDEAAKRHGVSSSSLFGWGKRLGVKRGAASPKGKQQPQKQASRFVEVPKTESELFWAGGCFTARFPNGVTLSVPTGAPAAAVVEIVSGLMQGIGSGE